MRRQFLIVPQLIVLAVFITGCVSTGEKAEPKMKEYRRLTAKPYYSGFEIAHDTYNAISAASDGNIYYVLSSQPQTW